MTLQRLRNGLNDIKIKAERGGGMSYESIIFKIHKKYNICLDVCQEIFDVYKRINQLDKLNELLEG